MAHHLRASFLFPQTKRVPIHRAFRAEPHCLGVPVSALCRRARSLRDLLLRRRSLLHRALLRRCRRTMGSKADHPRLQAFPVAFDHRGHPDDRARQLRAHREHAADDEGYLFGLLRFHDSVNHAGAHQHLSGPVVGSGRDGHEPECVDAVFQHPDAGRDHARSFHPFRHAARLPDTREPLREVAAVHDEDLLRGRIHLVLLSQDSLPTDRGPRNHAFSARPEKLAATLGFGIQRRCHEGPHQGDRGEHRYRKTVSRRQL